MSVGNVNPTNNKEYYKNNLNTQPKKPNEFGGINLSSHVKIYDPNTKEVFVQKRGDD